MTVQRKQTRRLWIGFVLSFIPDSVIAYVVMRVTESGLVGFALTFFGLWAVYLAIWLKNSIWSWLMFLTWDRRNRTEVFLSALRAGELPRPNDFEQSADAYFERIVNDEKASVDSRLKAMASIAQQRLLSEIGMLQAFLQTSMAMDDALEQYKNQFPPKVAEPDPKDEPPDEGSEGSEDEAQLVAQVQRTCQVAALSAGDHDNENERRRFNNRLDKAFDVATTIRDEFYRSSAFHELVSTLIKDGQLERAEDLMREITVDFILDKAMAELRAAKAR